MFSLYLFALIVGGGLLVFSLFGGHDSHHGDVGHVGGHGGHHDSHGHNPVQWLSLRTLTYFLFVFGGVGAILTKTWHAATLPLILLLSVVTGLGVGAAVSLAFGYLRKTDSGAHDSDDSFIGLPGSITLPIGSGGMGKVLVQRGDRTYELLARPLDAAAKGGGRVKVEVGDHRRDEWRHRAGDAERRSGVQGNLFSQSIAGVKSWKLSWERSSPRASSSPPCWR